VTDGTNYPEEPVIHDRRRIDPRTGAVRPEAAGPGHPAQPGHAVPPHPGADRPAGPGAPIPPGEPQAEQALQSALAERTEDLQRLQAEYVNYRRRVERDRATVKELALATVLGELLPVLDDIGRAREHGELEGGFKSVAESLESIVAKLGLVRFGQKGELFDPTVHEALMHSYSSEVTEPTCVEILQPGYRFGERVVRPARVAVAEPNSGVPEDSGDVPPNPDLF
jgi:molecular chaperone GrpE